MKKFYFSLLLCFAVLGCQMNENSKLRKLAESKSVESANKDSNDFDVLFKSYMEETENETELIKRFTEINLKVLKRSYHYLKKFDLNLESIHSSCMAKRKKVVKNSDSVKCESPMDSSEYWKLQATRIVYHDELEKFAYYYQRLLDLANAQDDTLTIVFDETKERLADAGPEQISDQSRTARGVLTIWDTELRDLIRISTERDSVGPISYELSIELFKRKELAQEEWSKISGKPFRPSSIVNGLKDVADFYADVQDKFDLEVKEAANLDDPEMVTEVYAELRNQMTREPQSVSWRNHTGQNFSRGQWALTYDDGPKSSTTNQILDTLASRGWHATFFWLAQNARSGSNSRVVARAKSMGMGLASHSYSHADLGRSSANLDKEIRQAKSTLESVYGKRLNFFRLPYGSGRGSSRVKNMITSLDMEHFFWNVDSLDWKKSSPSTIYQRTKKQMDVQGRGIILFHDIHQRTVETTRLLARNLPNLNVIPLERGAGIGSSANGGSRQRVSSEPFTPHNRKITAGVLNVRLGGSGTAACGELHAGDRVSVQAVNSNGWYKIGVTSNVPRAKSGNGSVNHVCPAPGAWISGDSRYSVKY